MAERVPEILVEQLALGELTPERAAEVRQRLEAEPGGLARLTAIAASNDEILEQYPAEQVVPVLAEKLRRRTPAQRRAIWRPALIAAPLAAAAVLVAVWVLPADDGGQGKGPAELAIWNATKGDPRLVLHRKGTGTEIERLQSGAIAREGDLIQVGYLPSQARHGVIVSVDGRGEVTLHLPADIGHSTRLRAIEGAKGQALHTTAFAYELDDAPNFERFFFVTASKPIDIGAILDTARSLGPSRDHPLALAPGLRVVEFVLAKQPATGGDAQR